MPQESRIHKGMGEDKYKEAVHQIFKEVDANGDGVLQLDEYKIFCINVSEASGQAPETDFEALRQKKDIHWATLFNLIDVDHSGELDWDEIWNEMED